MSRCAACSLEHGWRSQFVGFLKGRRLPEARDICVSSQMNGGKNPFRLAPPLKGLQISSVVMAVCHYVRLLSGDCFSVAEGD